MSVPSTYVLMIIFGRAPGDGDCGALIGSIAADFRVADKPPILSRQFMDILIPVHLSGEEKSSGQHAKYAQKIMPAMQSS